MEVHKIIENIINNENDCETNKESPTELENKLKKQIQQLKSVILQIEWSLDISQFSKTKCVIQSQIPSVACSNEIPNINVHLEFELYKYSGYYCTKYEKQECIFNFSSLNNYDKENTFAIQILNNNEKITLGKWLMPMSINPNNISNFSIDNIRDLPYFLNICKHYIDCYFLRHKQFVALKDKVSHIKNCTLQTSLGYTQINLELMGVCDKTKDKYIHIIVYLLYNTGEIRPHKIKVDSVTGEALNSTSIKHLKQSLACFKKLDLHVAFDEILNKEPFVWSREEDEDSPLEINNTSDSDSGGFLEEILTSKEKSLEFSRRKRKIRRKQKMVKKKKTSEFQNSLNISINNTQVSSLQSEEQEKEEQVENRKQHTASKIDGGVTESTPIVNKLNNKKLKQKKLLFDKGTLSLSTRNVSVSAVPSEITPRSKKTVSKKRIRPVTSTPVHQRDQGPNLTTSSNTDISDITVENNLQNIKNKMNINSPKSSKRKEKGHVESSTPIKLLKAKIKRNLKFAK